jgi:formamidopyrimidine-DNA glycosylase
LKAARGRAHEIDPHQAACSLDAQYAKYTGGVIRIGAGLELREVGRTVAVRIKPGVIGIARLKPISYLPAIGQAVAKYLVFHLSGEETLIIHLKMTGHLFLTQADNPLDKHTHTVFSLASGKELRFQDIRKFGRVYLVHDPQEIFSQLGPEPLAESFTADCLRQQLNGRTRILKPLLLDQTFVAGIGNIYADEALFYAGLHPQRRADSLTADAIKALHAAIQKVLQLGIEREGASISNYIKPDGSKGDMQNAVAVFRRTGMPCYQCGNSIQRIVLGGRSTHFCPHCQI